jgi:hypothetical protein
MTLIIQKPTGAKLNLAQTFTWNETIWNPSMISTALWLDAADSTKVFSDDGTTVVTNGGTVQQWNDKSGNALHISQSTAGQRPLYSTNALNGRAILTFDGSDDILFRATGLNGASTISIFAVMRYVSASGEDIAMGVGETGSTGAVRAMYRANGGTTQGFAGWSRDVISSAYSTDTGGGHHIFAGWNTDLSGGNHVFISRDGLSTAYTPTGGGVLANTAAGFSVGSLRGTLVASYRSNISVGEILVLTSPPELTIRQRIEGYLAHKWGLTANLPNDHPYKTVGPTP